MLIIIRFRTNSQLKRSELPSSTTPLSFDAHLPRNPSEYLRIQHLTFLEIKLSSYILPLIVWVYIHSIFSGGLRKTIFFLQECVWTVAIKAPLIATFDRSRPSKVIDFGTNRKHVCNFRHSVIVTLVVHTVSEILQVFVLMTPPLFHSNFGGHSCRTGSPLLGSARAETLS